MGKILGTIVTNAIILLGAMAFVKVIAVFIQAMEVLENMIEMSQMTF